MKHKGEIPKSPKQLNPGIPDDLAGVILNCLEKDRSRRYQAASDIRAELERIEKGLPTTARVAPERKPFTSRQITVSFPLKKVIIPAAAIIAVAVIGIALIKILPKKAAPPAAPTIRSIAVLPFENRSDPKEDEAFSDGITDDITTQLSKISELDVRSQTSAMRYKKSSLGIQEIDRELNVAHILVGSVQRAEGKVHITTRLIDTATDKNIWADTFDRDWKEILSIQSDIAQQIGAALKATLTPAERERIEKKPTKDIAAYEYYVKGREYYFRYRKDDNEQAIELFKKAIEQSQVYLSKLPGYGGAIRSAALAELFAGHYEKAEEYYKKSGGAPIGLGYLYWKSGKKDEARKIFQKNLESLQKLLEEGDESYNTRVSMAAIYAVQGNKEEALRWLQKALDYGMTEYRYYSRYPLFENIREDERFKRIMDEAKAKVAVMRLRVEQLERDSSK